MASIAAPLRGGLHLARTFGTTNSRYSSISSSYTDYIPKELLVCYQSRGFKPVLIASQYKVAGRTVSNSRPLCSSVDTERSGKIFRGNTEILFEGCDYEHWFITMEFPDPQPTREEKIDTFIKTLAKVVGSEEEAKKRIYALSTTTYTGFQAQISEETSEKLKGLPGVVWVLPDSYIDPVNKEYGGSIMSSQKVGLNNASIFGQCNFRGLSATQPICFDNFSSPVSIKSGTIHRNTKRRLIIYATSKPLNTHAYAGDSWPLKKKYSLQTVGNILNAFYRFSRPHTVTGTVIGIVSVSLLAVQSLSDFSPAFWIGLLQAVVPALFMNIYIVGLNQLYDIEIDKINKPYLPLASGEYSARTGVVIVAAFAFLSLGFGVMVGSAPLLWALSVSLVLGTAYSTDLPFLRWKRSAVAAASCILCVRAIVVQLAFYLHMQSFVYKRTAILTKPLIFATAFMCFFSVVIALFKDIPDVDGDRVFGIQSFSVRLGQERVFWLCIYLLQAAYGVAIVMGGVSLLMWSKLLMVLGHSILATILWNQAVSLDLKSKEAITSFYMFVWKLFYAEYLLIPFMR